MNTFKIFSKAFAILFKQQHVLTLVACASLLFILAALPSKLAPTISQFFQWGFSEMPIKPFSQALLSLGVSVILAFPVSIFGIASLSNITLSILEENEAVPAPKSIGTLLKTSLPYIRRTALVFTIAFIIFCFLAIIGAGLVMVAYIFISIEVEMESFLIGAAFLQLFLVVFSVFFASLPTLHPMLLFITALMTRQEKPGIVFTKGIKFCFRNAGRFLGFSLSLASLEFIALMIMTLPASLSTIRVYKQIIQGETTVLEPTSRIAGIFISLLPSLFLPFLMAFAIIACVIFYHQFTAPKTSASEKPQLPSESSS